MKNNKRKESLGLSLDQEIENALLESKEIKKEKASVKPTVEEIKKAKEEGNSYPEAQYNHEEVNYSDSELLDILTENGYAVSFSNLNKFKKGLKDGTIVLEKTQETVVTECKKSEAECKKPEVHDTREEIVKVSKANKPEKLYKSHTDHFLKEYLTEECDFSYEDVENLTEAEKTATMNDLAKIVIDSIISKLDLLDTSSADRSRGEIKALKELPDLQDAITKLEAILERGNSFEPAAKKYLGTIIKSILYLNQYSNVFKDAYRNKKTLLIVKYETLILSIISSVSYLISSVIEFKNNDVLLKKSVSIEEIAPLKSLADFNKSVESGEFKIIVNDITLVREYYNEHPVETMSQLCESTIDVVNMVVNGIKNWYSSINSNELTQKIYKWTGIVVLLLSVRDVIYSISRMKAKSSDMLEIISNFANLNNGGGLMKKIASFASSFKTDAESASEMGSLEVEADNKKLATQVRAIKAAPVIEKEPQKVEEPKAMPSESDIFNFNF